MTCYVDQGVLCYEYNLFEIQRTPIKAAGKIAAGKRKIEIESKPAEARPAAPLDVTLKVDGQIVAQGRVPISAPLAFTANDCLDLGSDLGSPVSREYFDRAPFKFNGTLGTTTIQYAK